MKIIMKLSLIFICYLFLLPVYPAFTIQSQKGWQSPVYAAETTPQTVKFLYDGDGVRVAKIERDKTTVYVGDMEKNINSGETIKYYGLGGKRIAVKDNSGTNYIVSEHLGSLTVLTDSSGNPKSDIKYYPYGTVRVKTGTAIASRQYTSQINDDSTGLYFYNARYYNPETANFIQADSGGGANKYAYVSGNPINFNDPSGNEDEPIDFAPPGNLYPETGISSSQEIDSTIKGPTTCFNMPGGCTQEQIDQWNMESLHITAQVSFAAVNTVMLIGAAPAVIISLRTIIGGIIGNTALKLYERYGNQELSGAVNALRSGRAADAIRSAEKTWQKVDPGFQGFKVTKLPPGYGGLGNEISKDLPPTRQASLALHETSHQLDMTFQRAHSTLGKNVTVSQHYGLQVQSTWATEAKAYMTEVAAGSRTLNGAVRGWFFSNAKYASFPDQLRTVLFER